MNPLFKALGTILRGAAKGFPLVNAIVETVGNIKAKKAINTEVLGEAIKSNVIVKLNENGEPKEPHNWLSIAFQVITVGIVLYAFFTKQMTADSVLSLLRSLGGF